MAVDFNHFYGGCKLSICEMIKPLLFYFKEIIINTIGFLMPNDIYFYYRHDLRRAYREDSSL